MGYKLADGKDGKSVQSDSSIDAVLAAEARLAPGGPSSNASAVGAA
jgi:hypothetical protein